METEELAGKWIMFDKFCSFNDLVRIKRLQIIGNLLRIAELHEALQKGFELFHCTDVSRLIGCRFRLIEVGPSDDNAAASGMGYLVAQLAKPFERFLDGFCGVPTAVFAQGLLNRGHPTEVVPFSTPHRCIAAPLRGFWG
jgi:hypothetical protein